MYTYILKRQGSKETITEFNKNFYVDFNKGDEIYYGDLKYCVNHKAIELKHGYSEPVIILFVVDITYYRGNFD